MHTGKVKAKVCALDSETVTITRKGLTKKVILIYKVSFLLCIDAGTPYKISSFNVIWTFRETINSYLAWQWPWHHMNKRMKGYVGLYFLAPTASQSQVQQKKKGHFHQQLEHNGSHHLLINRHFNCFWWLHLKTKFQQSLHTYIQQSNPPVVLGSNSTRF